MKIRLMRRLSIRTSGFLGVMVGEEENIGRWMKNEIYHACLVAFDLCFRSGMHASPVIWPDTCKRDNNKQQ